MINIRTLYIKTLTELLSKQEYSEELINLIRQFIDLIESKNKSDKCFYTKKGGKYLNNLLKAREQEIENSFMFIKYIIEYFNK